MFAVAAVAKLRDPSGTATSFADLAIPRAALAARVVPAVELALAAALVVVPLVGAVAALATLVFFTTLLAGRIRAGFSAPCRCFGSMSDAPLSWSAVTRNVGFCVLAVLGVLGS